MLLFGSLLGCTGESKMSRPATVEDAVRMTDQLMESARSVISSDLKFGNGDRQDRSPCEGGAGRQVYATRSLQLIGADPKKFSEYQSNIRDWWSNNGFEINGESAASGWVTAMNESGFSMRLVTNKRGEAYLGVSSPCV